MSYKVFASPVPVPEARRGTMIGLRFDTEMQARERACTLYHARWNVYRISGPDGFEMTQDEIAEYCKGPPREL